jgi:hypothetical protein
MSGNLVVSGDLTINGTTTTVSTTNMVISDNLIELNNGVTGSPTKDAGIIIERGDQSNAFIGWDESADKFIVGTTTSDGSYSLSNLTISTGTIVANVEGNITGDVTGNADTATKIGSITNSNIVQLTDTQTLTNKSLTSPTITGSGAIAGVFTGAITGDVTGDVTGNADTATKIGSITNSNIVQLTDAQTLTNKSLTSPTITGTLTIEGTTLNATAAELNTYVLNVALDDISTASSCFVVAPKAGTISKISSIIDGTTATADAVITANVNGGANNITAQITIASGSAATAIDTCSPSDNNTVTAGQYIKLTTNGGSTNTVKAVFTIEITY